MRRVNNFFFLNIGDFFITAFFILSFLFFIGISTYVYFARDLVTPESIMNRNNAGVVLFDRHDRPFFAFYQAKHTSVIPLSEIPKSIQQAVVAVEDKDFYRHKGFSLKAISRSILADIQEGHLAYGGSTITQQLVKNALLSSKKNFLRKYQEIVLALEIERRYNKEQILEMYLNSVYFGEGAFGIEQASQKYFNKPAKELTLAESAMIAGLLPSPSRFSPYNGDLSQAKVRQKFVLQKMAEQNYISQEEKIKVENEYLAFTPPNDPLNTRAIQFALMAKDELIKKYGEEVISRSGFKVKTSIDLDWQDFTQQTLEEQIKKLAPNRVTNGAAVVIIPQTGEIRAVAGSRDWYYPEFGKVNVALMLRQPGSSFKPIYYAVALDQRLITPATVLKDQPVTYSGNETGAVPYKPQNYDNKFRGLVLVRRALANSLNVPSVEVMSKLGVAKALEAAQKFGITTFTDPSRYGLSLALGAGEVKLLELTGAYAALANYGQRNDPTTILEIRDKFGNLVYQYQPQPQTAVSPEAAFLVSSILSDKNTRQEIFSNLLDVNRTAAVKTGTTQNYRDSWTMGYTPSLAVGVWVGNNDGTYMDNVAGSLGAAPVWKALIEKFTEGTPDEQFIPPPGVVSLSVCRQNGLLLKETTFSGYLEYFIKGTEPTGVCILPEPSPSSSPSHSP